MQPLDQNVVAKYLVQYVPETPKSAVKPSTNRVFGRRVLTSDEGYNFLASKEEKKAEEIREKARKKKEREEKKKQKEAAKLRTAEAKKNKAKKKRKRTNKPISTEIDENTCCECLHTYEEDIKQGTGAEWVQCACERWLHESCISTNQVELDENDKEKLCSRCM